MDLEIKDIAFKSDPYENLKGDLKHLNIIKINFSGFLVLELSDGQSSAAKCLALVLLENYLSLSKDELEPLDLYPYFLACLHIAGEYIYGENNLLTTQRVTNYKFGIKEEKIKECVENIVEKLNPVYSYRCPDHEFDSATENERGFWIQLRTKEGWHLLTMKEQCDKIKENERRRMGL
jgi:hypothetical protein